MVRVGSSVLSCTFRCFIYLLLHIQRHNYGQQEEEKETRRNVPFQLWEENPSFINTWGSLSILIGSREVTWPCLKVQHENYSKSVLTQPGDIVSSRALSDDFAERANI